jgi:hypothetical protein
MKATGRWKSHKHTSGSKMLDEAAPCLRQFLGSQCRCPGLIPGLPMWHLWWIKKYWDMFHMYCGFTLSIIMSPELHIHSSTILGCYSRPVSNHSTSGISCSILRTQKEKGPAYTCPSTCACIRMCVCVHTCKLVGGRQGGGQSLRAYMTTKRGTSPQWQINLFLLTPFHLTSGIPVTQCDA